MTVENALAVVGQQEQQQAVDLVPVEMVELDTEFDVEELSLELDADVLRNQLALDPLYEFILAHDLYYDQDEGGDVCATVEMGLGPAAVPIRSSTFRDRIIALFALNFGVPPKTSDVKEAIQIVTSLAPILASPREITVRVGGTRESVWIDLGGADDPFVSVSKEGVKRHSESPVGFRRPSGLGSLPEPMEGGSIEELRELTSLERDSDWILLKAWLCAGLVPFGPHPILVLQGVQGSGKTILCRMLRSLIDPHADALRTLPRSERDMMVATQRNWLMAFDNISEIKQAMSDSFCRLATGSAFGSRKLYTDTDEVTIRARRPCLLNGIGDFVVAGDLLDRSLTVPIREISDADRKHEASLWEHFNAIRPRLFGALLEAVAEGMRNYDTVELGFMPRMADFAHWAVAAGPALGFNEEEFRRAILENRAANDVLAVDSEPIGPVLIRLMQAKKSWSGTCTELLNVLNAMTAVAPAQRCGSKWPRNATGLGRQIRRIKPALERLTVRIAFDRAGAKKNDRIVIITRVEADS